MILEMIGAVIVNMCIGFILIGLIFYIIYILDEINKSLKRLKKMDEYLHRYDVKETKR